MKPSQSINCRFAAFFLLSLSACSSATDDGVLTPPTGGASTGGAAPANGGITATTGGLPSAGGTASSTGGFASQGGTTAGFSNSGGQLSQGGSSGGNTPNGGTFGQGGTLTGGTGNGGTPTGGFSNGGAGAGGKGGGGRSTGGSSNGGMGTAGKASGGATTGGSATGGSGGDPFGGGSICTSRTTWKSGENQNMRPGEACIACHATNKGPDFNIAGTVYPTGHEPNDCNGKGGLTIVITDAKGTAHNLTVNAVGNFNFTGQLSMPYTAKVTSSAGASRAMLTAQMTGDCNTCHTEKGMNGAPGRIVAP